MRPLVDQNSDSDSSDEENLITPTPFQPFEVPNRPTTSLVIVKGLNTASTSHKTFLVRSRTEGQNIVSPTDEDSLFILEQHQTAASNIQSESQGINLESVQQVQEEQASHSPLRVIKVFDKDKQQALKKFDHQLSKLEILVGTKFNIIKTYGAVNVQHDTIFSDNDNQIHHYPQGYCMLMQEYCSNGDLLNLLLNKGHLCDKNNHQLIRNLFTQIFESINQLHHAEDLCLLNLSLNKILLDKALKPKSYDFEMTTSLAQNLSKQDFSSKFETEQDRMYLAPEILNTDLNLPLLGDKIDVFALGVMLFISIFKQPPFTMASVKDPLYKMLISKNQRQQEQYFRMHPATRGIDIDDDLKQMIKDMLTIDPLQRPTVRELMQNKWLQQQSKEQCPINKVHPKV